MYADSRDDAYDDNEIKELMITGCTLLCKSGVNIDQEGGPGDNLPALHDVIFEKADTL